ncbi:MAG: hypothetical protein J0M35_13660 [Candidatus Obscuribacter phosphatis]|uniref:Uncharacterized protein n=1 Tax=Candidatus Obscuribacter phosphatis TaxID=1906157 RepID=A0A8J7PHA8_9BACT|nr:hypothetical protein [Candidatus Obscuribacter phosphatis]
MTKDGKTIDFYLSPARSAAMAKRFLCRVLKKMKLEDRRLRYRLFPGPVARQKTRQSPFS